MKSEMQIVHFYLVGQSYFILKYQYSNSVIKLETVDHKNIGVLELLLES